jgi:hypothetical protein
MAPHFRTDGCPFSAQRCGRWPGDISRHLGTGHHYVDNHEGTVDVRGNVRNGTVVYVSGNELS